MERVLTKLSILWAAVIFIQMHGYRGCLEKERIGLLEIKAFFFKSVIDWETDKILISWVDDKMSDCCGWEKVKCNATTGRVVELSLNNIRTFSYGYSTLNLSLFHPFEELQSLDLSGNFFEGWYENKAYDGFRSLKQLKTLNLSYNSFNSSLLPYLNTLTSLTTLILQNTGLEGIKSEQVLQNLTNLETLDLSYNSISSSPGLANLKNLKVLDLSWNKFNSSLSSLGICKLKNLIELDLKDNNFDGLLSQCISNLTNLEILHLSGNGISSPPGLASLKNLKVLDLSLNKINSSLSSLGYENLEKLDLSDNGMNTSLSELGICKLKYLIELDLSNNNFDGLSQCLSNLTHLKVLDLSSNQLSGKFSSFIANLTSLEYLSLSFNNFEGLFSFSSLATLSKLEVFLLSPQNNMFQLVNETWLPTYQLKVLFLPNCNLHLIPSFLLHQYNLRFIDLSDNQLVGNFPTWLLQNNSKLETIYLRNNSFTGMLQLPNSKRDLVDLDISSNNFNGQLPKNIGTILPTMESINMSKNSFEGSLPSSMGEMRELDFLDLSSNNLTSELPTHFLTGCYSLTYLILTDNNFQGQIFPKYMNLTLLQWLCLDNNHFSKVGDGLMKATGLRVLDISNNKIHGQLPHWIGNLSGLWILDISENSLSGPIPPLSNLSSVLHLYMQKNALNGSIPNSLFKSPTLIISDLRDNEFSGSIVQQINEHSNMHILLLGGNNLEGHIPNQLCQLRKLSILDLSHNRLSGSIPPCFTNMLFWMSGLHYDHELTQKLFFFGEGSFTNYYNSSLFLNPFFDDFDFGSRQAEVDFITKNRNYSYKGDILKYMSGLDLSSNELTGQIPPEIGDLQEIHALNLSHNYFSGSIPQSFSHLKMIESLDLSCNRLSGRIPTQLTELNFLAIFNVSYNNLSGPTPNQGQFANFDDSNYGGNPSLCGPLLKKTCTSMQAPSSPPSNGEEKEDESAIDIVAFYWSFVAAYFTMVLALVVILWINSYWRRSWFYFIDVCIDYCFYWFSKYVF